MIDLGEAQVFEGKMAEASDGFVGGELLGADLIKQRRRASGFMVRDHSRGRQRFEVRLQR